MFKGLYALCFFMLMLVGCASDNDPLQIRGKTDQQIYTRAHDALERGSYDRAIKLYNALEATYPYGSYAQQGLLDLAYAYYEYDQYENALTTIEQFITTYTTSANMDYALYLKGYINYRHTDGFFSRITRQPPSEIDQTGLKIAYTVFNDLVKNYPKSKYKDDAQDKINEIVNALATAEMIKTHYYMGMRAYVAAINRSNLIITTYSSTKYREEALAIQIVAYKNLKLDDLMADTKKILALNYPQSKYLKQDWVYKDSPWYKIY